jgi:hypothetical protein
MVRDRQHEGDEQDEGEQGGAIQVTGVGAFVATGRRAAIGAPQRLIRCVICPPRA